MYQLCRLPSKDVRFNVTLSPTSTAREGPGTLSEVFVSPQPVLRLPYSWIGRSRAASAGTAIPMDPRRRTAKVAATRMRRSKVNICIPPVGGARATPPDKDIAPTARMVAKWTLRRKRAPFIAEALRPAHTGSVAAPGSVRGQGGRRARGPWMILSPRIEGSPLGGPLSSSRSPRHPITFDHALPRFHLLRALRARGLQGGWFLRGQSDLELSEDVAPLGGHRLAILVPSVPIVNGVDLRVLPGDGDHQRIPDARGGFRRNLIVEDGRVRHLGHPPDNEVRGALHVAGLLRRDAAPGTQVQNRPPSPWDRRHSSSRSFESMSQARGSWLVSEWTWATGRMNPRLAAVRIIWYVAARERDRIPRSSWAVAGP